MLGFKQDLREFFSSKSNWAGIGMIAGGLVGIYTKADLTISMQAIIGGLALIFVKDAIAGK